MVDFLCKVGNTHGHKSSIMQIVVQPIISWYFEVQQSIDTQIARYKEEVKLINVYMCVCVFKSRYALTALAVCLGSRQSLDYVLQMAVDAVVSLSLPPANILISTVTKHKCENFIFGFITPSDLLPVLKNGFLTAALLLRPFLMKLQRTENCLRSLLCLFQFHNDFQMLFICCR